MRAALAVVCLAVVLYGLGDITVDRFSQPSLTETQLFLKNWALIVVMTLAGLAGLILTQRET